MYHLSIPTYIINLKRRPDRKTQILKEFEGREEFNVSFVEAFEDTIGAIGLWKTIKHIISNLANPEHEYILICEDDHQFTEYYSKDQIFDCIEMAKRNEADILLGGVSSVRTSLHYVKSLFWIEKFSGSQFVVLFTKFFTTILKAEFSVMDSADHKLSSLTIKKFIVFPFISTQKEFGYSDVTKLNNEKGRVSELFSTTAETIKTLSNVAEYYKSKPVKPSNKNEVDPPCNFTIPTYIINLPTRTDRLEHIKKQFDGKKEFDIVFVEACKQKIGAVGLWNSIRKIAQIALDNEDDVIIICEDDHEFTEDYSKEYLFKNIFEAHWQGADILSGGTGGFDHAIPIAANRYWLNPSLATQFIIIYKKFFTRILDEPFDETVIADILLSEMTANKMVLYPFISTQKNFGYSDVTSIHNKNIGLVDTLFAESAKRLNTIQRQVIQNKYFIQ